MDALSATKAYAVQLSKYPVYSKCSQKNMPTHTYTPPECNHAHFETMGGVPSSIAHPNPNHPPAAAPNHDRIFRPTDVNNHRARPSDPSVPTWCRCRWRFARARTRVARIPPSPAADASQTNGRAHSTCACVLIENRARSGMSGMHAQCIPHLTH